MKLTKNTYKIELTVEELGVLESAIALAYNTAFLQVNPSYTDEKHQGFYTDVVERNLVRLTESETLAELKKMLNLIQREGGNYQTW